MPHISGQAAGHRGGHAAAYPRAARTFLTVAELGYPEFETSQWYGIIGPTSTPTEIVDKLTIEINKALTTNAITQRFANDNAHGRRPHARPTSRSSSRWSRTAGARW